MREITDVSFSRRRLILTLALKEFRVRYKNARLGFLWALIYPVMLMLLFNVVFTRIINIGVPRYPLFLLPGLFAWTFFASSMSNATVSLLDNARLIKKIYFPRTALPASVILANGINFILSLILLLLVMMFAGIRLSPYLVFLPLIVIIHTGLITAASIITSYLFIRFRDIKYLVEVTLLMMFYATPVFYPISFVPDKIYPFYILNPMAGIISAYRNVIFRGMPPDFGLLAVPLLITTALFVIGSHVVKKYGPTAADYL